MLFRLMLRIKFPNICIFDLKTLLFGTTKIKFLIKNKIADNRKMLPLPPSGGKPTLIKIT